MGHADHRHSTTQMTKQYGIQTLLDVVLGNNQNQLTQIASSLVNLRSLAKMKKMLMRNR
jgi:hypothetical protein